MYALGLPLGPSPHQVSAPLVRHDRGLFIITYPILGIPYYDCGSNGPQNSILNIKAPLVGPRGSFSESGSRGSTSDDRCLIKLGTPPKP